MTVLDGVPYRLDIGELPGEPPLRTVVMLGDGLALQRLPVSHDVTATRWYGHRNGMTRLALSWPDVCALSNRITVLPDPL